mgnify:CR=1 FL=1
MTRESCSDSEAGLLLGTMVQPPHNQCNKVQLPRKIVLEFETTKLVFEKWAPTFASHVPDLTNQYCAVLLF